MQALPYQMHTANCICDIPLQTFRKQLKMNSPHHPSHVPGFAHRLAFFLLDYASAQLAAGAQTMRVARSVARIASRFGYVCHATFLSRHITLTIVLQEGAPVTMVGTVPNMGLNFSQLVALNKLSWLALDNNLSFADICNRFHEIMAAPRFRPVVVLLAASCANAAFCRLFGGDISAMFFVFLATLIALKLRQHLDKLHVAPCLSFLIAAFTSSLLVATCSLAGVSATPQIAIGSSVLFLIPGVPMINSTLDLLTGFPLMAFSRLVRSGMLVSCIGLGLGCTLLITNQEMGVITPALPITNIWLDLALDGFFAAIASMGFATFSNPGVSVVCVSGLLAALGHVVRLYLLQTTDLGIIAASFFAALLIGIVCIALAKKFHIPGEFFSFLALLPMIPGMYAYGVILSTIQFMDVQIAAQAMPHLVNLARNFLSVLFIMCAMALGAIAPLLIQHIVVIRTEHPY